MFTKEKKRREKSKVIKAMKQIAIIDDDVYIGDMLSELLSREGYGVLRAYSGDRKSVV